MNIIMDIIMNIIMERDLNLRQQINPDKECLKYPYKFHGELFFSIEIILVKFVMVFILANVIIRGLIVMEQ